MITKQDFRRKMDDLLRVDNAVTARAVEHASMPGGMYDTIYGIAETKIGKYGWLFGEGNDRVVIPSDIESIIQDYNEENPKYKEIKAALEFSNVIDGGKNKLEITKRAILTNKIMMGKNEAKVSKILSKMSKKGLLPVEIDTQQFYSDNKIPDGIELSVCPWEFMTSAYNCSFDSCYRPGGLHFLGTTSHINSEFAIIMKIKDPEGKTQSRMWIYIEDGAIIAMRNYNGVSPAAINGAMNYIKNKYSIKMGFDGSWQNALDEDNYTLSHPSIEVANTQGCIDQPYFWMSDSHDYDEGSSYIDEATQVWVNESARCRSICLEFGDGIDVTGEFTTKNRITNDIELCACCGELKDPYYVTAEGRDGQRYCDSCRRTEAITYCDDCCTWHEGDMDVVDDNTVCGDCLGEHYFECDECGAYHNNRHKVVMDGRDLCKGCSGRISCVCENCEARVYKSDIAGTEDNKLVCSSCR